jgi:hypothetical protein
MKEQRQRETRVEGRVVSDLESRGYETWDQKDWSLQIACLCQQPVSSRFSFRTSAHNCRGQRGMLRALRIRRRQRLLLEFVETTHQECMYCYCSLFAAISHFFYGSGISEASFM